RHPHRPAAHPAGGDRLRAAPLGRPAARRYPLRRPHQARPHQPGFSRLIRVSVHDPDTPEPHGMILKVESLALSPVRRLRRWTLSVGSTASTRGLRRWPRITHGDLWNRPGVLVTSIGTTLYGMESFSERDAPCWAGSHAG